MSHSSHPAALSPLHQFEVKTLIPFSIGGYDLSFTNASFFMVLTVISIVIFLKFSFRKGKQKNKEIPSKSQMVGEMLYQFTAQQLDETAGKAGKAYFPFIFSLFLFILGANLFGMIPYAYTVTSQLVVTFTLAMMVFLVTTCVGILRHGVHFISYFVPSGVPKFLFPLIVPIELISYLSRPISLSIRLFANMMAGHTMLKVFAMFTVMMGLWGIAPLLVNMLMTVFEIIVAILQAYVFTILTCIYLSDALYLH